MKFSTFAILALAATGIAGNASGQALAATPYDASQGDSGYYDYGQVIRVAPVMLPRGLASAANSRCTTRDDGYLDDGRRDPDGYYRTGPSQGSNAGRAVSSIIGSVVGALVGSQVGGGSVRYATSAIGGSVGALAGQHVYDEAQRERERASVTVCPPMSVGPRDAAFDEPWFDVTYLYGGRTYTTRTRYNPGERIRIRVDVRAE